MQIYYRFFCVFVHFFAKCSFQIIFLCFASFSHFCGFSPFLTSIKRAKTNRKSLSLLTYLVTLLLGARDTHARESIDVAYIDANHTKQATLRYFDHLAKSKRSSSIFVLDDIHHSREMAEAWRQICQREDVTTTMDLYHIGLVFFDKQYLKRHYKLRI